MTELTPEKRAELRECVSREPNLEAVYWHIGGVTLKALLDAADELDRVQQEERAEQVKRIKAEHLRFRVSGKYYCVVDEMEWPCLSIRTLDADV